MPTSLQRTLKSIEKKKGKVNALHEKSRDSKRLHRAQVRDEKLRKLAASREKALQPYIERAAFFQEALKQNKGEALSEETIQDLIKTYVQQYDEELSEVKKARRPGRPASTREDLLKLKVANLQKEYQYHGFLIPVLTTRENAILLERWTGSYSFLTTLAWVRVSSDGKVEPSTFPPKGDH
ncbi:translation machinery-associated protein 16 [Xylariaceae sp. FL0804]|nr:translation machinery-associated protein 16 [Xylariaceae sp. FL0804]